MRGNSEPPKRIQVSLRTFLIAVLAAGMTLGILGQLFRRQPEVFVFVFYLLATIVPAVSAIVTVFWIGFHRSPVWSLPMCSGCRRDLRWLDLNAVTNCPQCDADLTASKALAFERGPYRSRLMIAWGGALVLMPAVGILGVILFSRAAGPGPGNLGLLSNQEVIQKRLLPQVDQPWVWQELERRLAAGKLSQKEVDDAVKVLIGHMKAIRPNGWDQPLSWQQSFLRSAASAGLISEPVQIDLCDAFYGPKAELQPLPRVREDGRSVSIGVEYGSDWGDSYGLGVKLLWEVVAVRLDGKPLDIRHTNKTSGRWSGQYEGALPAGDHELEVEIECAYIDEALLVGLNTNEMPAKTWPEDLKRWTQAVSTPYKVYTKDEPILTLATDLGRSPLQTGGIQVNRLVVQNDRNGKKRIGLNLDYNERLDIPIGFDVALKLGDEQIQLGHIFASIKPGRSITGGKQLQKRVDSLDPSIRQADIILTPNPRQIEQYPEVKEFWGETIVIPGVPLDRFE